MNAPNQPPNHDQALDASMRDLKQSIAQALDRDVRTPAPAPSPPRAGPPAARPVDPKAGGGGSLWGPSSQRVTSPLQLLASVVDNAARLQMQVNGLAERITGTPPGFRAREVRKLPNALLPAVAVLATEVDAIHAQIGQLIERLQEEL